MPCDLIIFSFSIILTFNKYTEVWNMSYCKADIFACMQYNLKSSINY
jgi:hypothetical protein